MAASVIDRDLGFAALRARVALANLKGVTVGVHADEGSKGYGEGEPVTIADVAEWMEFGTEHVPERSFVRGAVEEYDVEIKEVIRTLGVKLLSNARLDPVRALNLLGLKVQSLIRQRIRDRIDPELADETIARKGSSVPLIDTGQLIQSITWRVV